MKNFIKIIPAVLIAAILSSCASSYLKNGKMAHSDLMYLDAIENFEKGLAKKEDIEAQRLLADSYMKTNQFDKASALYEEYSLDPAYNDVDRTNHGRALMSIGKYNEAMNLFEGVLSRNASDAVAQSLMLSCKNINELKKDSSMFGLEQVVIPGFSSYFAPANYENGLLFSAEKIKSGSKKDQYTGDSYMDLYYLEHQDNGWKAPVAIENVNGRYHDGIATASADGNTMILTRSYYTAKNRLGKDANNTNNTQLYITKKNAEGEWSEPESLPFNDIHYMFAHPSLSADGNTLYYSSDLQGGYGGMDIYSTTWNGTEWSKSENIGVNINRVGDEAFPSLVGNDTLFFSSDSHTSIGGLDILYSVKRGGAWSEPYHLGYPINSASDDFGVSMNADRTTGYLSSDREGKDRIYAFEMFNPELVLKGLVTDKDKLSPLEKIKITVENLTDGTTEELITNRDGEFTLDLLPGKNYRITAENDTYFKVTKDVSTVGKTADEQIDVVFEMQPLVLTDNSDTDTDTDTDDGTGEGAGDESGDETGTGDDSGEGDNDNANNNDNDDDSDELVEYTYPIPMIYWDYNKAEVKPESKPYLEDIVKLFRDNEEINVVINSHCDSRGSNYFNDKLSKRRAKAVVDYLVAKGVPRRMLKSHGYGKRKLLNDCKVGVECSEDKHQVNRRTDFIVTGKKKK